MSLTGRVVADTHAVIWYLQGSPRISTPARAALDETTGAGLPVLVSAMTLVELRYLVEKGAFTESEAAEFDDVLGVEDSSFEVVPVDDDVAHAVGRIPREAVADRPVRPDDRSHRIGARSASGYT